MSFEGKVVAITGAGSGIGLALTKLLASRGAKLALADNNQDALSKVYAELKEQGFPLIARAVDVSKASDVKDWIDETMHVYGRIDGAANIAGIEMVFTNIEDTPDDVWNKVLGVNLSGVFLCVREQVKVMQPGSSIVNAASLAGVMGRPGLGAYVCSKHGVVGLTKTVAKEVGGKGIRVNAVAP